MDLFGEEPLDSPEETFEPAASSLTEEQPGLAAPRQSSLCIGHHDIESRLLELYNSGRMPHGLIFAGQKGTGKATLAYRFARFLLKNGIKEDAQDSLFGDAPVAPKSLDVDANDPVFRKIASGGHPDFMSVEREYDEAKSKQAAGVSVDDIRKVPGFLRMTASDGGWRVVVIDDADTMNRNAQNALLKILEEPPKNSVLILVTHRLGALIPTIRSRTQLMNFQPLEAGNIEVLLAREGISTRDIKTLAALSEGSVGRAIDYAREGGLEALVQLCQVLEDYPRWRWPEIHKLADGLAAHGQDRAYAVFADVFQWLFSQLVMAKARGERPRYLEGFVPETSLEKLLKICENLQQHFERVRAANLDKRQGVLSAFSILTAG